MPRHGNRDNLLLDGLLVSNADLKANVGVVVFQDHVHKAG